MSNSEQSLIEDNIKCSCKGYSLDKLIQVNLLIILAKQDLHGYMIIQELEKRNLFYGNMPDNTGVYRALKILEDKEMVRSEWVLGESGPAKKNYSITLKGMECLTIWVKTLKGYKEMIEKIIEDAENVLKETCLDD